ncbi:hypothetical protein Pmar_PMAR026382 [Perkinsus marinus ATCC 50983]|uniref:Uncharacterized protein n=1 Tax=Perkinsus marinus (strain ATCC 50983 / TXsc) TaxID=423536 RepID=C5LEL2_PERM5|nr:hypothetical protein Pmar_PMAR026382 [Perkinsus marinus ATCC 50983]EER04830.1 hypothetical protein Pmar_PMAR026382 [Perkinsus marinus ATCC 50983]|eukprot:XP_002773014.1 hypothetical protein Pmar_PMAR026382 [Perkinsus marinus ATCC 50983]
MQLEKQGSPILPSAVSPALSNLSGSSSTRSFPNTLLHKLNEARIKATSKIPGAVRAKLYTLLTQWIDPRDIFYRLVLSLGEKMKGEEQMRKLTQLAAR